MFGSKDKPEHPQQGPDRGDDARGGKKGLFGWMRRKADEPASETPAPSDVPVPEQASIPQASAAEAAASVESAAASQPAAQQPSHDQAARQAAEQLFGGLSEQMAPEPPQPQEEPKGFFARMRAGLSKTSANLGEGMANLFLGEKEIDDELLEEMETRLLMADVGIEATTLIMESLQQRVRRRELSNRNALYRALQN